MMKTNCEDVRNLKWLDEMKTSVKKQLDKFEVARFSCDVLFVWLLLICFKQDYHGPLFNFTQ